MGGDTALVFFLLGDTPSSELFMPTFRNTLFFLHRSYEQGESFFLFTRPTKMEQSKCSETSA
jgi:hypothetical protein